PETPGHHQMPVPGNGDKMLPCLHNLKPSFLFGVYYKIGGGKKQPSPDFSRGGNDLLIGLDPVHGGLAIQSAGGDKGAGEVGMVQGVGIGLGFQTHEAVALVGSAALSGLGSAEGGA